MILRIAILLLLALVVIGMVGKWLRPGIPPKAKGTAIEAARKCARCGAYVLGSPPAPCERPDCAYR